MSSVKPLTIEEKIRKIQKDIQSGDPEGLGPELQVAATKAVYAGFGKTEWNNYMRHFASTKNQLLRLTTTDLDYCYPDYIPQARAYLVANSLCLPGTWDNMMRGIDDYLDRTLDELPADPIEER